MPLSAMPRPTGGHIEHGIGQTQQVAMSTRLPDYFSQMQPILAWSGPAGFDFLSQADSSDVGRRPPTRRDYDDVNLYLDLNSQAPEFLGTDFPHLDSYQKLLQSGSGEFDNGNRGNRGGANWRPPRQSRLGGRGGHNDHATSTNGGRGAAATNGGCGAAAMGGGRVAAASNSSRGTSSGGHGACSVGRGSSSGGRGAEQSVTWGGDESKDYPIGAGGNGGPSTPSKAGDGMDDEEETMMGLSSSDDEDDVSTIDLTVKHQRKKRR